MKIGVVFPQTELGSDPTVIRDYTETVEGLGYNHVLAYDHVLGANPERPGGWTGPYTYKSSFMEPFSLFSYMAGLTTRLEFATGVIILPQRQTALVAKQAATLDVLCGGKLRLGVGIGWNPVEYTGLNENFKNRGKRIEEQIAVMRALWTDPLVNFEGRWHHIDDAGLLPFPVQRPIPVWMGGQADVVLKRTARIADGWMANHRSVEAAKGALEILYRELDAAGRDRGTFGLEARLPIAGDAATSWSESVKGWAAAGATHLSINTMGAGYTTPAEHIQAVKAFASAIDLSA